jgi:aryl-alcohol dehydrogenase-like predicted oxidoreductase
MAARGNRDSLVIATKVGMSEEHPGLSRQSILRGAEDSLRRLRSDRIDLYYAHRDDPDTPLQETLSAFAELIAAGSVRYVAASNYSAARLAEALSVAEQEGLPAYVALQPNYNLLDRGEYEGELMALCEREQLACLPYFSLARGFLTGKYRRGGAEIESPRAAGVRESYFNDRGFAVLAALDQVAGEHDSSVAAVALAWLLAQPTVLAPIASATSPAQLSELMAAPALALTADQLERLSRAAAT